MEQGDGRLSIGSILAGETETKFGFDMGVLFLIRALMLPASQMVEMESEKRGRGMHEIG
jgi:hypothetical protein